MSNQSRYGHALRKNFLKSRKQNLKDFVNTTEKSTELLGSARMKVTDTSKDQKDKQQLAPNKKKKKNRIAGSKNMHNVKKQEFTDLSKLLSIQNDVSMLQKFTKDDMNDISI